MKEASQPLELLVLEPEKKQVDSSIELNQNKIPIQTQMRIDVFFFVRKIVKSKCPVVRKKMGEEE